MPSSLPTLNASHIRATVASKREDTERMGDLARHRPLDRAAVLALIDGLGCPEWRVVCGVCQCLGEAVEGAEEAVAGLLEALSHHEASVRHHAAESLLKLSARATVPPAPLWAAMIGEDEPLGTVAMGEALLAALRKSPDAVPTEMRSSLRPLLISISAGKLTRLPLGGQFARRQPGPAAPAPPSRGFFSRLFGGQSAAPDSSPQFRTGEDLVVFEQDRGELSDPFGLFALLANLWAAVETDPEKRFAMLLELSLVPVLHANTRGALAVALAGASVTDAHKAAVLASLPIGSESQANRDPSLDLARARPEWRADIFASRLAARSAIDWSNWRYSLRDASASELQSLAARVAEAPDEEVDGWMKLLAEASVAPLLSAYGRALRSSDPDVVSSALAKLGAYGQPLPTLLPQLEKLLDIWKDHAGIVTAAESAIGQTHAGGAARAGSAPVGFREPRWIGEFTLDDEARTPSSKGELKPWQEGLRHLEAVSVGGSDAVLVLTTEKMISLPLDGSAAAVRFLPKEMFGPGLDLLAAGHAGELLFRGSWGYGEKIYLIGPGAKDWVRFEPSLPSDELPSESPLLSDGRDYGWAETAWKMSHFESDPGHDEEVAYRLNTAAGSLEKVDKASLGGMTPLGTPTLSSGDFERPALSFRFSKDGGFRVCDAEGLAIRGGGESPLHSSGRAGGREAIFLEVFPSRLCRIYLWDRAADKGDMDPIEALESHLFAGS